MTARINPDSRPVLVLTVALTVTVALVSFVLSFAALRDAAAWGNVPPALAWSVPVIIDLSVLVYTAAALVQRARGESARLSLALVGTFSVVSVISNAAHGLAITGDHQMWVGVVLVALAPVSVLTSVHTLASLVVASPGAVTVPVASATPAKAQVVIQQLDIRPTEREVLASLASGHPGSKRTPETLARVLMMVREGQSRKAIAAAVGISPALLSTALRDLRDAGLVTA